MKAVPGANWVPSGMVTSLMNAALSQELPVDPVFLGDVGEGSLMVGLDVAVGVSVGVEVSVGVGVSVG